MASDRSIMIVEDDDDARQMAQMILEHQGFSVETAANGKEAVEKLKSVIPALILLDIMMPEMNGYDVLVHLKQRPETQNIPVIMLTAKGTGDDMITGYQHGADYYIPKPYTREQLLYGIKLFIN
ncbi:MAG: response regulator [Bdellovibrionales bacterium]|nr:response regulator [Bdellovibrionales bacterium]